MASPENARRDRALRGFYKEGKEAGSGFMANKADCPYEHEPSAARAAWMLGFKDGQADLAKAFNEYWPDRSLLESGRLTERDKRMLRQ